MLLMRTMDNSDNKDHNSGHTEAGRDEQSEQSNGDAIVSAKCKSSRPRNGNESCEHSADDRNAATDDTPATPDSKRQRPHSSNTSVPVSPISMSLFPNGVPASPPRFVSLEEIMKAANDVENLVLAHEIAVDKDFKLEKLESSRNSLENQVKEVMHKAFWDILESQLNESPTNYKQAMILLKEIKEHILSLLLPQHTRLQQEIDDILDLELILQQADNGILDFQRYAQYVLSVCARLCAPIRDEQIRELTQTTDVVPLFRGILGLLDVMKLDMANFHIQQMRPHIQQKSIEYERQKFQEVLDRQSNTGMNGLDYTKFWLKRNYESIDLSNETNPQTIINKILINAYLELLLWDESKQDLYPETLLLDAVRFDSLKAKVRKFTLIGSVFLVTYATVGAPIQGLQEFKCKLKDHLFLLINESNNKSAEELKNEMTSVSLQVLSEVETCLKSHSFPPLDNTRSDLLKSQITDISNGDNRVRKVVERRILEFVEGVLSSPTAAPMQIPTGLSHLQTELSEIAGQFIRIVAHNRAVFSKYYANIISEIVPHVSFAELN